MNRCWQLTLLLVALLAATQSLAQGDDQVVTGRLTALDRGYMDARRSEIDDLSRRYLGRQLRGEKANDLAILQALLDQRRVKPGQTAELQGMGMVLGDLLGDELGMHWVTYEDKLGRSRALRLGDTEHYLFPVTMISRRVEAGSRVNVVAVYDKAYRIIAPHKTPLPFQ